MTMAAPDLGFEEAEATRPRLALRDYQRDAIDAAYQWHGTHEGNCLLVVPTGGGKSLIMGTLAAEAVAGGARVLIIAHRKELIEQNWKALQFAGMKAYDCGIISGQHGRKDRSTPATVASIQTIARNPYNYGPFDLILIDECFPEGTPVSTPFGDVPIESIRPGHIVHHALGRGAVRAVASRETTHLLTIELTDGTVLRCTERHPIFTAQGFIEAGELAIGTRVFRREDVRALREAVSSVDTARREWCADSHDEAGAVGPATVLQYLLLEAEGECDVRSGRASQGECDTESAWTSPAPAGRQWDGTHGAAASLSGDSGGTVVRGARHPYRAAREGRAGDQLQAGSREPRDAHRHRVRRRLALGQAYRGGSEEGHVPGHVRVARVSRTECGRGTRVFNLHVSGHPSYFAHGILAHNCHLVPKNDDTSYRKYLHAAHIQRPTLRCVGLTATPYRLDSGRLDQGEDRVFAEIAYEIPIQTLLDQGFLCPLISKATLARYEVDGVATRGGEYVESQLQAAVDDPATTAAVIAELSQLAANRQRWLVFCAGVQHAEHMADAMTAAGFPAAAVHGELGSHERASRLAALRNGTLRALTNCDVLTTGYDEPSIDLLALCRPTASTGLHVQMLGRGFRPHPGKDNTLVLDFAGNCLRHGPVDAVKVRDPKKKGEGPAPAKECPDCHEIVGTATRICPRCQFAFPPPAPVQLAPTAMLSPVMAREKGPAMWREVTSVEYSRHVPRDPKKKDTFRVDYKFHFARVATEWICIEHEGFARQKAEQWWADHLGGLCPRTIDDALDVAEQLEEPVAIQVEPDGQFERVVNYRFSNDAQPLNAPPKSPDSLPRACWSCAHFDELTKHCQHWQADPPSDVQRVGCDAWDDVDELPF